MTNKSAEAVAIVEEFPRVNDGFNRFQRGHGREEDLGFPSIRSDADAFNSAVKEQVEEFSSCRVAGLLRDGKIEKQHYHAVLLTIFPQSYHGPYNMGLAAVRCSWRHSAAKEFLIKHAAEEASHWRWILDDLKNTGYQGADPRELCPHWTCEAYVSFAERISEQAPYARLATNSVLEGIAATFGAQYGRTLLKSLSLRPDQASFFLNHGETDKEHIVEIREVIASCDFSSEEWGWMTHTARLAGRFYRAMYDHEMYA